MHMLNGVSIVDMVHFDFAKAFDKVHHGILPHKVKDIGITGKLGQWFYHFLTNRKYFVRLPGGLSDDHTAGLGSSTVDQVLKYTKYPKYIPSTSTGQVLIFFKKYLSTSSTHKQK